MGCLGPGKMKQLPRQIIRILTLIILGAILIIGYSLIRQERRPPQKSPVSLEAEEVYRIGEITVDARKGEIRFKGEIRKNKGWVQFLLYLQGYKWLKEESAIVSQANLLDLQQAIALLNWKLWDDLWYRKKGGSQLSMSLEWKEGERVRAEEVISTQDTLGIEDLLFLGSPYFDPIVLGSSLWTDCTICPIFPLEQKMLREEFQRKSGQSGYEVNLPPEGTKVIIVINVEKA